MIFNLDLFDFNHDHEFVEFFKDNKIYFRCLHTTSGYFFFGAYEFEATNEDMILFYLRFGQLDNELFSTKASPRLRQIDNFSVMWAYTENTTDISHMMYHGKNI